MDSQPRSRPGDAILSIPSEPLSIIVTAELSSGRGIMGPTPQAARGVSGAASGRNGVAAIAFFRGRSHLLEYANEEFVALSQAPLIIGAPSAEQLVGYPSVHAAMDVAYDSGRASVVILPRGRLTAVARREKGQIVGVVTHFRVAPVRLHPGLSEHPAKPLAQTG